MKLVTFGDSWVWGDEIENDSNHYNPNYSTFKHMNNIGGKIFSEYKLDDYLNLSINGGSNQHILYQLSNYILSDRYDKNDFIVIGLTSPMRQIIYSNLTKKYIGNWPNWNLETYLENTNDPLINSYMFKTWWESHVQMNINAHNDVLNYSQVCLSIKGLLSNHKKYIVWQSIDSKFWDVYQSEDIKKDGFFIRGEDLDLHYQKDPFDKYSLNSLLKNTTTEYQTWINIDESSWMDYLINNFEKDDVFVWSSMHPTINGVNYWFEYIRKYIDKILI